MTSFMICTTKCFPGDRMKKNEIGGGHVECIGERGGACGVLVRKSSGKRPLETHIYNERIILKGYSRNRMKAWTSFVWLRIGTGCRLF